MEYINRLSEGIVSRCTVVDLELAELLFESVEEGKTVEEGSFLVLHALSFRVVILCLLC